MVQQRSLLVALAAFCLQVTTLGSVAAGPVDVEPSISAEDLASDDVCTVGAAPDACGVSLRQLRGDRKVASGNGTLSAEGQDPVGSQAWLNGVIAKVEQDMADARKHEAAAEASEQKIKDMLHNLHVQQQCAHYGACHQQGHSEGNCCPTVSGDFLDCCFGQSVADAPTQSSGSSAGGGGGSQIGTGAGFDKPAAADAKANAGWSSQSGGGASVDGALASSTDDSGPTAHAVVGASVDGALAPSTDDAGPTADAVAGGSSDIGVGPIIQSTAPLGSPFGSSFAASGGEHDGTRLVVMSPQGCLESVAE
eukprot:CAMPEP_0183445350 /NCGR_PEP_ID=MMETSP0370-20130417/96260_1 /TAXON_ID=268820 /ORGANISM="Peridinium aciculiferum, Strain PAER-2" /LENGTH=307 /DNA_ID=CAMNT_0025635903 /DNA_START=68 /DNA_END=989 /DNA_ORIENTATION=+